MSQPPNIVLIMTDQQRADTIGALGWPWAQTPHLDALAAQGVAFNNCFVTSPVCVSSRASLFRGMYPHSTNVFTNFEPWQPNWVQWLADAGYHCANIGKMHINPYDAAGGFHQRFVVENKDRPLFLDEHERAFYDEWDKAIRAHGQIKPSRYTRSTQDPENFASALGCFSWELDEQLHPDTFVGNTARWWINERQAQSPFFLQVGFPGPHPPYDPPQRWLDQYSDNLDIPITPVSQEELAGQPSMHAALRDTMQRFNIDSVAWRENLTQPELQRLWRHYLANVSLIDDQVGQLLNALEQRGYLENTVVMFTSDHADALGQHGHIQKWTMYDCAVQVPLICRLPNHLSADSTVGSSCDELVQLMDLAPTILSLAGLPVPDNWEAESVLPYLLDEEQPNHQAREFAYAELGKDHIQSSAEYIVMRRDKNVKLVMYPGTEEGELYDLGEDPGETVNQWNNPKWREYRDRAITETLQWSVIGNHRAHRQPTPKPQVPMKITRG